MFHFTLNIILSNVKNRFPRHRQEQLSRSKVKVKDKFKVKVKVKFKDKFNVKVKVKVKVKFNVKVRGVVKTLMIMNGSYVGITKIHHYPHFIMNNIPLAIVFIV